MLGKFKSSIMDSSRWVDIDFLLMTAVTKCWQFTERIQECMMSFFNAEGRGSSLVTSPPPQLSLLLA